MKTREWMIENRGWQARNNVGQASRLPGERFRASHFSHRRFFAEGFAIGWAGRMSALLSAALFSLAISAVAQNYSIDWYKVAGGGGTSSNNQYAVSGTIGQHDAGRPMTGGNYSLTGGFWALISVVQTPGAPTLYISLSGNTVTVYWQDVSGWTLQQNGNPANPGGWSANSNWMTSDGTNYLNLTSPTGNLFFRLSNP